MNFSREIIGDSGTKGVSFKLHIPAPKGRLNLFISLLLSAVLLRTDYAYAAPVVALLIVFFHLFFFNIEVEESVLMLPSVGLQYSVRSGFQKKETFVHWGNIIDVIIKEVIYSQKIIYLLTIVAKDESGNKYHLPLFDSITPRLQYLEMMYRDICAILHNS